MQNTACAHLLSAGGGANTNVQHVVDSTNSTGAALRAAHFYANIANNSQGARAVPRRALTAPAPVLSSHSTMTQTSNRHGRLQRSVHSRSHHHQLLRRTSTNMSSPLTYAASLEAGSSKKRKVLGEETAESLQDLFDYYDSPAFHYDLKRLNAANLGSSTTGQAAGLQPMSAAQHQASLAPHYAAIAHNPTQNADGFISSSPLAKRRKLMRASSSWGSSDSVAATFDPTLAPSATHGPPTTGMAQDSIWRPAPSLPPASVLYFTGRPITAAAHPGTDPLSAFHAPAGVPTPPLYHQAATVPAAPQAPAANAVPGLFAASVPPQGFYMEPRQARSPAGVLGSTYPAAPQDASQMARHTNPMAPKTTSRVAPQAAPHDHLMASPHAAASTQPQAYPQAPPQMPPQALPQAPPEAPSQVPAAAPAQRAGYQEGQVVWGKCRGHPWWPATVSHLITVTAFSGTTFTYMSLMKACSKVSVHFATALQIMQTS